MHNWYKVGNTSVDPFVLKVLFDIRGVFISLSTKWNIEGHSHIQYGVSTPTPPMIHVLCSFGECRMISSRVMK